MSNVLAFSIPACDVHRGGEFAPPLIASRFAHMCDECEALVVSNLDAVEGVAVTDAVNHPVHYGGADNPYEVIKVAEAWKFDKDAYLFQVLKYIARAGKKSEGTLVEDLRKAAFYLNRRIERVEKGS